jgi:hypothetical protein
MIRFTSENGRPVCEALATGGFSVYLDNDSLITLAKTRDTMLRDRFVAAIRAGGTLLFSLTNAIEISGPQEDSALAVRALLESIGPHWVPLELNPFKVVRREQREGPEHAPVSREFMEAYFQRRAYDLSPGGSLIVDLSPETFFRLGSVLDWVQEERDTIRADIHVIDEALRTKLRELRVKYEEDPSALDRLLPPLAYDDSRPGTFVFVHLLRLLVVEAKAFQFKKNDALDFCHAVLGAAYGSLATLDKQWKGRIERLPKPSRLARMFYRPELPELVATLESLVARRAPS